MADVDGKIQEVIRECNVGFASYDPSGYVRIQEILMGLPQTDAVKKALRMAIAGPTLSSPRFAYPHIKDALQ